MANPTWDLLDKNQSDPEKIEAAIIRMIDAHDADPEAHLGATGSLTAHKADTMIDHPAGSVAIDKFSRTRLLMSSFESIAGLLDYKGGTGNILNQLGSVTLLTGATSASYAGLAGQTDGHVSFAANKDCFWRLTLKLAQITSQSVYFGLGYLIDLADFNGFGFKVTNGNLYIYMGDFDHYVETQINGVTLTVLHTYEVRYDASAPRVDFYIDGVLVGSFTTGYFPTDDDNFFGAIIKNTAASAKYMYLYNFMYQQDY